ncbi:hypothetical protein ABFB09_09465 [Dehalogenimonas sp. THU2]|uniref:hypothetical protein n=1 Tax=Dehalogenimonas sp. THU2 TaxID=3151121 RepID=UPI003218D8D5
MTIYTPENGLKLLARMIAEAYLEELAEEAKKARLARKKKEEVHHADQGSQPTHQVAEAEEDQSGNQNETESESDTDTVYLSPTANLLSIQEER